MAAFYMGFSALFWISAWFAGRHELRPLIATWVLAIGFFVWWKTAEILLMMKYGLIWAVMVAPMLISVIYLVLGLVVSVVLYRETSAQRARQSRPLLERQGRR